MNPPPHCRREQALSAPFWRRHCRVGAGGRLTGDPGQDRKRGLDLGCITTGTTGFDVDVPWGQLRAEVAGRPR